MSMPELVVGALALALVHFIWQAFVVGLLVVLVDRLCTGGRPSGGVRWRHAIELTGLLALPVIFVSTLLHDLGTPGAVSLGARGLVEPAARFAPTWTGWVTSVWAIGVVAMLSRTGAGWWWLTRIRASAEPMDGPWVERVRDLARRLGSSAQVRLLRSSHVDSPMVFGWLRPVILVPIAFVSKLEPLQVEAVLLHELAHVRRLDPLVGWIESIVRALFFFHPVVWWLGKRIERSREHCCDDEAVRALSRGSRPPEHPGRVLAEALFALESQRATRPVAPAMAATGAGALLERVARLLGVPQTRRTASIADRWPWIVVLTFVLGGVWAHHTRLDASRSSAASVPKLATAWLPPSVRIWAPILHEAGQRHGVDPELLAVMTFVESRGNPWAVSRAGALGLMQVMPSTAAEIARARGMEPPTPERLADPAYNVDLAAWYLARQLERFDTDDPVQRVGRAAAAYNAGPHRFAEHLERGRPLPAETRRYRSLVTALWSERHDPVSQTLTGAKP